MFIFERERARPGEAQRERETDRLRTVSTEPDAGLSLTNHEMVTWAEVKSLTLNRLSHPGAPTLSLLNFVLMFISFWERERYRVWAVAGQKKRGRHRIQSRLWAVSTEPDVGLEPMNHGMVTWAEVGRSTYWVTQHPITFSFSNYLKALLIQEISFSSIFFLTISKHTAKFKEVHREIPYMQYPDSTITVHYSYIIMYLSAHLSIQLKN